MYCEWWISLGNDSLGNNMGIHPSSIQRKMYKPGGNLNGTNQLLFLIYPELET